MEWYYIVLIVLTSLTALWWLSSFILSNVFFGKPKKKIDLNASEEEITRKVPNSWKRWIPTIRKNYIEYKQFFDANHEEYEIISDRGNKIKGWLIRNKNSINSKKPTVVLFAHGYRSTHETDLVNTTNWMFHDGYDTFTFDQEVYGESEGKHTGFGATDADNVVKWVEVINKIYNHKVNIILEGVSMGANTVMLTANREMENVKCIIADCGYTSGYEQFKHLMKVKVLYGSIRAYLKITWGIDYKKVSTLDTLKEAKYPVLFIHGTKDKFVPTKFSIQNYEICSSEKELVLVEGATHAQNSLVNPELYYKSIHEFVIKYNK